MIQYNKEYVEKNLIAYIGNKRRLLPLIFKSIEKTRIIEEKDNPSFLDIFSGTGVISRLAKSLGFYTTSNDWEYYSYIINKSFLELDDNFLNTSFTSLGGIGNVISILNGFSEPRKKDAYISKYYCPQDDSRPDTENERMFYTSYNGKKIDAIRAQIQEWADKDLINKQEEQFLIALLLYESSTRSNTSGVFKAFHNGFGGTNGDALSRILKPIELTIPKLINGMPSRVFNEDAVELSSKLSSQQFDIAYLDPPYNQHQYGSNYHLLNTIAKNDKPSINKEVFINGKKVNKSAIRRDWVKTKSSFCYKKSAKDDFVKLITNINSKHILVSYSTDGIIPFDDMLEILSKKGKLDICMQEYVKYRGGKQSLTSKVKNIEFILMVNTSIQGNKQDIVNVKKQLLTKKIELTMANTIDPFKAELMGFSFVKTATSKNLTKFYDDKKIILKINTNKITNLSNILEIVVNSNLKFLGDLEHDLMEITNITKENEINLTIDAIMHLIEKKKYNEVCNLFKNIPYCLSKFNNKKAYISSLKSIISILTMLSQTISTWMRIDILNNSAFRKFEKIIFKKINYDSNQVEAKELKNKISILYKYFVENFSKNIIMYNKSKTKVI